MCQITSVSKKIWTNLKVLKDIKCADQNKAVQQEFFLKIINVQDKYQYTCSMQYAKDMQGEFFLKINKRADQNKAVQGGFFSSKLINVHARLFGTLEYLPNLPTRFIGNLLLELVLENAR